jgi:uncharacterized membrane protein
MTCDRTAPGCGETPVMSMSRLESFSDGVIAVAITLLVLNIEVPPTNSGHSLGYELVKQWPIYAAYVTSFLTIGIIWINHHWMIRRLAEADRSILMLNLLLLLWIAVLPFGTRLMATYLKQSQGQSLAAAIYAGLLLVMSITFATLNRHILFRKAHLLPLSAYATLAICAAVAVFYALPIGAGGAETG